MDEIENLEEEPEEQEEEQASGGGRSWLLIVLVGVAMLLLGGLLGYVGRGEFGPEAQAAKATQQQQVVLAATQAAANADLMKYLSENTRHYKGDPNAAVTIIEFSDYQ